MVGEPRRLDPCTSGCRSPLPIWGGCSLLCGVVRCREIHIPRITPSPRGNGPKRQNLTMVFIFFLIFLVIHCVISVTYIDRPFSHVFSLFFVFFVLGLLYFHLLVFFRTENTFIPRKKSFVDLSFYVFFSAEPRQKRALHTPYF